MCSKVEANPKKQANTLKKTKPSKKRYIIFTIMAAMFILLNDSHDSQCAAPGANSAIKVLCDIILILRGRLGRALFMFQVLKTSYSIITSPSSDGFSMDKFLGLALGGAILFGAEGFVYIILPSRVTGIQGPNPSGAAYSPTEYYTPEQLVRDQCPELARY